MVQLRAAVRRWAAALIGDVMALWFCWRHPLTPWYAKLAAGLVAGYALSPIDLIPDFIPVIGYLDDLLLVPAGIWIALKLVPASILTQCRIQAEDWMRRQRETPRNRTAAVVIACLWVAAITALSAWAWKTLR